MNLLDWIFQTDGYPARWQCGVGWEDTPWVGWAHVLSDIGVWGAYMAIPALLVFFLRRRKISFPGILWLFGAFIVSCGMVHALDAVIFWHPLYRLSALLKIVTACVSWVTVFALARLLPQLLKLPDLAEMNTALQREVRQRTEMEELLRAILDGSPTGILVAEADGSISFTNPALRRFLGYTQEELAGSNVDDLVPEAQRAAHAEMRGAFLAAPEARPMGAGRDLMARCKDGHSIPIEIGLNPLHGDSQGPARVVATVADITQRKELEREALELDSMLHRIVENAVDQAIFLLDEAGCITSWNVGAERIYGYCPAEALGQSSAILLPGAEGDVLEEELRIAREESSYKESGWRVRKNGERFWADVVLSPLRDDRGRLQGYSKFVRDLTESKHNEEQLRSYAFRLERANEGLEEFAYIASHDLRSPLNGIAVLSNWLREDEAEKLSEEGREHLEQIEERVLGMQGLLEDLLSLARAGQEVDAEEVDTEELVLEIEELLGASPYEIVMPDPMPTIHTARTPLRTVLMNLISNARKHHDQERGTIAVRSRPTGIGYEFEVRDDGPGIPRKHQQRIFRIFQTLQPGVTPAGAERNSGMGLAIVKKTVERLGGILRLESKPGSGSTFYFTWPELNATPESGEAPSLASSSRKAS